jgi:hypothetical protein
MIQIIIAMLITLGKLSSVEHWDQLNPTQQNEMIIGTDTVIG